MKEIWGFGRLAAEEVWGFGRLGLWAFGCRPVGERRLGGAVVQRGEPERAVDDSSRETGTVGGGRWVS